MYKTKEVSIEQLYREAFPFVARIVAHLGGDLEAAKDIFHDALIIYLEKQRSGYLEIKASPTAYVTGIARILWIRKFNQQSRITSIVDGEDIAIPADFYSVKEELPSELTSQLLSAGKKCLELLQAFYYEQQSMREIAARFQYSSRHSATVQKYKCLEKVREQFKTVASYEEAIA